MKLVIFLTMLILPIFSFAQVSTTSRPALVIDPVTGAISSVTISGVFSAKPPVVLYDKADVAYEHGVINSALSAIPADKGLTKNDFMYNLKAAWANSGNGVIYIKKDPLHQRYEKAGGYYFSESNNVHLQSPRAQSKDKAWGADEPKQLYVSWWYKQQNDTRDYFTFSLTDVAATFAPVEGDEFVIDVGAHWSGVTRVFGRVINYNPATKTLAANFYGQNNANRITGKVLKLDKNNATALLSASTGWQGSNKYIRIWESDGADDAMRMSWTNTEIYVVELRGYNHSSVIAREWNHLEVFVDQTKRLVKTKVNGKLDYEGTYTGTADKPGFAPSIGLIGFDSNQEMFQRIWMDDIYMDNTFQRVTLGNAPKYSAVTHEEIQQVDSWTTSTVKFAPNYGSLDRSLPAYVYVYDKNGVPNPDGILFESPPKMD